MPKKPFTAEEIAAQRERIMDSASSVMAESAFTICPCVSCASAGNDYREQYLQLLPNKESLFIHTRRRGFDLWPCRY